MGSLTTIMEEVGVHLDALSAYELLEVAKDVSQEEIKPAFHRQAKKWHPDVNRRPDAEARFKHILRSYEILSDPEKRSLYDRGLLSQDSVDLDECYRAYSEALREYELVKTLVERWHKYERPVAGVVVAAVLLACGFLIWSNNKLNELEAGNQEILQLLRDIQRPEEGSPRLEP